MVNSDNGRIIQEVLLSVAKEYDLPGVEPNVKIVVMMSVEEMQKYTGTFDVDEYGPLEIFVDEDHLRLEADFLDEPIHLLAENDTLFFDRNDGTQIDFDLEEGLVSGFNVQELQARRTR
jgi:hypothetical protein